MESKSNKKKSPPWNLNTQIKGALRKVSSRSPQHRECMELAVHPTIKGPRGGKQYICAKCKETFSGNKVHVDHIEEVIPLNKSIEEMSWDEIIKRMFCSIAKLQVLCKDCHKKKTSEERKKRKEFKKLKRKDL